MSPKWPIQPTVLGLQMHKTCILGDICCKFNGLDLWELI